MIDKISVTRLATAHPSLRDELKSILSEIEKVMPKNLMARYSYVLRTNAEQDALYAQGRTKPGKIVTNAKGGDSYHNYGLAVDVVLLKDNDNNGTYEEIYWTVGKEFMKIVSIFKAHGWEWGGEWKKFPDNPHFQKTFGKSIAQLKSLPKKDGYPVI